jgi:hypothetical protein
MYVNRKMESVETIPGIREGGINENDGRGEFDTMYPQYNNTKKK